MVKFWCPSFVMECKRFRFGRGITRVAFSKWALSLIRLKKRCRSAVKLSRLNSPGTGQKLRFLLRSSNTSLLNTFLVRFTTVPLLSCFLRSFDERSFLMRLLPLRREITVALCLWKWRSCPLSVQDSGTAFFEGSLFCPLNGVDFCDPLKVAGFTSCCLPKVKFTRPWLAVCCSCLWLK